MFEGLRGERFDAEDEVEFARADLSAGGAGTRLGEVSMVLTFVAVPIRPGGNLFASCSRASANFLPKGPKPKAPLPADVEGGLISPADVGGEPPLNVVELPPGDVARRSSPPDDSASIPSTESGENDRACEDLTGDREAFA